MSTKKLDPIDWTAKSEREDLKSLAVTMQEPGVKQAVELFDHGLKDASSLQTVLPLLVLLSSALHPALVGVYDRYAKAADEADPRDFTAIADLARANLDDGFGEGLPPLPENMAGLNITRTAVWAWEIIRRMVEQLPQMDDAYRGLVSSTVVRVWTSYEAATQSLWEELVNSDFDIFGRTLLKSLKKGATGTGGAKPDQGLLHIDELERVDYDLRQKLGTALHHRYDFTRPAGVSEAFAALMPRSMSVRDTAANGDLCELCETRNLIVHRGGIVDRRFADSIAGSPTVGQRLDIDHSHLRRYFEASTREFRRLLDASLQYIQMGKSQKD